MAPWPQAIQTIVQLAAMRSKSNPHVTDALVTTSSAQQHHHSHEKSNTSTTTSSLECFAWPPKSMPQLTRDSSSSSSEDSPQLHSSTSSSTYPHHHHHHHPSCSSTAFHTPSSSPASPIDQISSQLDEYRCNSDENPLHSTQSPSISTSSSIHHDSIVSLSSPPAHPIARLRRSGPGGFYERDISAASSRSLADLLRDGSSSTPNVEDSTEDQKSCQIATPIVEFDQQLTPDQEAEINRYFNQNEEEAAVDSNASSASSSAEPPMIEEEPSSTSIVDHIVAPVTLPTESVPVASIPEPLSLEELRARAEALEKQEREHLLDVLACTLEQLCPTNVTLPTDPNYLSLFHTSSLPGITIRDYLIRLATYTAVSNECMIQALIHIRSLSRNGQAEVDRQTKLSLSMSMSMNDDLHSISSSSSSSNLSTSPSSSPLLASPHPRINSFSNQPFLVSAYNIHRLLLAALLTSAKFIDDQFYNNRIYSNLGGISLKELNRLEYEFLQLVDYRMFVPHEDFLREYEEMNHIDAHGQHRCVREHARGPHITVCPEDDYVQFDDEEEEQVSVSETLNVQAVRITDHLMEGVQMSIFHESHLVTHTSSYPSEASSTQQQQQSLVDESFMGDISVSADSSTSTTPIYVPLPSGTPPNDEMASTQHQQIYHSETILMSIPDTESQQQQQQQQVFDDQMAAQQHYQKLHQQQHHHHHHHSHHHHNHAESKYPYDERTVENHHSHHHHHHHNHHHHHHHHEQDLYAMIE